MNTLSKAIRQQRDCVICIELLRLAINVIVEKQEFHTKRHHPVSADLRLLCLSVQEENT